jgi:hypothetical protein
VAAATPSPAPSSYARTATVRTFVEALHEFEQTPAIVIASGSGSTCHAYWPLTEPLARDEVERAIECFRIK